MGVQGCDMDPNVYCTKGYLQTSYTNECIQFCNANFESAGPSKLWCQMGQYFFLHGKALNKGSKKATFEELESDAREQCVNVTAEYSKNINVPRVDVKALIDACQSGTESEKVRTVYENKNTAQGAERETGNNR